MSKSMSTNMLDFSNIISAARVLRYTLDKGIHQRYKFKKLSCVMDIFLYRQDEIAN